MARCSYSVNGVNLVSDLVRVNIRVTPEVHQWFLEKSKRTGVSMSSLMYLALEQHIQQQSVFPLVPEMAQFFERASALMGERSDGLDSEEASDRLDCPGSPK